MNTLRDHVPTARCGTLGTGRQPVLTVNPVPRGTYTERHLTMPSKPHTGQKAQTSGIYRPDNGGKEVAISKGDTLPPSNGDGTSYTLVRPTR